MGGVTATIASAMLLVLGSNPQNLDTFFLANLANFHVAAIFGISHTYLLVGQGRYSAHKFSLVKILITPSFRPPRSILTSPSCSPPLI